ncbi:MAG: 5'/3'-nucleotidase SurE [Pseudomonadota bacterium]
MTHYLVSNDDGVHAPGLAALVEAVSTIGTFAVVAPTENCSGASNKLTLNRPLVPHYMSNGFIALDGTPSDCVHIAINGLLDKEPDMVVSGINAGANLGDDVLYSGTVAAAIEGRFLQKPALAVSLVGGKPAHLSGATKIVRILLEVWHRFALPQPTILNVNIPDLDISEIKGFQVTRLGRRRRSAEVHTYINPRGETGYWIGLAGEGEDAGPGTDFHAVKNGFVSITALTVDMTRHQVIPDLQEWSSHLPLININ